MIACPPEKIDYHCMRSALQDPQGLCNGYSHVIPGERKDHSLSLLTDVRRKIERDGDR
jgi:hypothetical protein